MNETIWAVVVGGLIAIAGSAVTQYLLYWLNERSEAKKRRLQAIEYSTQLQAKKRDFTEEDAEIRVAEEEIELLISTIDGMSDDEISAVIGTAKGLLD